MKKIKIVGARQNNLKNIALEIPKYQITIFTGVSGSGKSSLVFETIGAEAQRQVNESQSSFARSRMQQFGVAEVDKIEHLNVPVIINQKRLGGNARSTVGTATDIYASLRLLFARLGEPFVGYSFVFSFNHPKGMCKRCEGLGYVSTIDIEALFDKEKSLNEGAILFPTFQPKGYRWLRYTLSGYFDNDKKLKDFTQKQWDLLLYAETHRPPDPSSGWGKTMEYVGIIPRIENDFLKKDSKETKLRTSELGRIVMQAKCPACGGKRLNATTLSCKINGKNIADCAEMAVEELLVFLQDISSVKYETILNELIKKLQNMESIGLGYLSLDRTTQTLSGGESQRIKMVRHLGNSLEDLLYIFDEPSIGLHPHDLDRISQIIQQIKSKGNTVLIVEHDPDLIKIADHVVDIGPGSGMQGGEIVYEGSFHDLKNSKGKTGQYFSEKRTFNQSPRESKEYFVIRNACLFNLQKITVAIPKNILTVVTGVAGSGKSTLISNVLPQQYPEAVIIDQSPMAASGRSNLLTYLGLSDRLRKLFATENKVSEKLFSTNSEGGCTNCKGLGIEKIDLAFMDDIEQPCEVCGGNGFDPKVLNYRFQDKNIAEVLQLSVKAAQSYFHHTDFSHAFQQLANLGLDYLSLGQRLNTFSGGERQRLKIAKEIPATPTLLVLDEPSTGLHPADTKKLLEVFNHLVRQGHTVIVIEHNLDIIAHADWVIDIGPEAGKKGGQVVFSGTVEALLEDESSITGKYLQKHVRQ